MTRARHRCVFLDRDGVITKALVREGKPYAPTDLSQLELAQEASKALLRLKQRGFLLIVVTNQPDVARGLTRLEMVAAMHEKLATQVPVDDFFVCYHDDADCCACRKPSPGLLLQAAEKHGIDLERSFMIGDRWRDVEAGQRAGCRTIMLDRGYRERQPAQAPNLRASSLTEAIDWILEKEKE